MSSMSSSKKTHYLLTLALKEKLASLKLTGLQVPASILDLAVRTQKELVEKIKKCLPTLEIKAVSLQDLSEEILIKAQTAGNSAMENAFIVSTCPEIAHPAHGQALEINRITDIHGKIIGLGPRPGFPSINDQIAAIVSASGKRPIVIMEDGAFTGHTLCDLINRFKKSGARVSAIILGYSFPEASDRIRQSLDGGELIVIDNDQQLVDWTPDYDFFPFLPNCGRVVGSSVNGSAYPFYTYDGYPRSIPYIFPYSPMPDWTGIRGDELEMRWLSDFCLQRSAEIFRLLEEANQRQLTVKELRRTRPTVAVPYAVGDDLYAGVASVRIVDYLHQIRQTIW